MTDSVASPIPAATILLLRDNPAHNPALEVLMIKRHAKISFGGAMVFPGGKIAPSDHAPEWRDHADGLPAEPALVAAMIAALREAFEETGILIARDSHGPVSPTMVETLNPYRKKIEADDAAFLMLMKENGLRLSCDALTLFAQWVGPPGMKKTFDTWFFAAHAPQGQKAREDGDEATEALWTTPDAVLTAHYDNARKLIFPTIRNLELLGLSNSAQDVIDFAHTRIIERITPAIKVRNGHALVTIPDHLGYPVTEEPVGKSFRK